MHFLCWRTHLELESEVSSFSPLDSISNANAKFLSVLSVLFRAMWKKTVTLSHLLERHRRLLAPNICECCTINLFMY